MTEPQITVKPYYHTGAIPTPFHGGMTITVTRMHDTSKPKDMFFGSVQTEDGEEALVLALEEAPDIIILDWMIANLSGIEGCPCLFLVRHRPRVRCALHMQPPRGGRDHHPNQQRRLLIHSPSWGFPTTWLAQPAKS